MTYPTTTAAYNRTAEVAAKSGEHWTQADLDAVTRMRAEGVRREDIARELQRTLYAVWTVRAGQQELRDKAAANARRNPPVPSDAGFTTLEAMGF